MNADQARALTKVGQKLIDESGIQVDDWSVGSNGTMLMLRLFKDGVETRWYTEVSTLNEHPHEAIANLKETFAPKIVLLN